jgi:hypothetical protein
MERVSELKIEPVVGRYYLVPCVQEMFGLWVPVIGPEHEDSAIINFPGQHFHRDLRFVSDADVKALAGHVSRAPICRPEEAALIVPTMSKNQITERPVERKMLCKRRMPDFPLFVKVRLAPHWMGPLERHYAHANAKCGRCPHRGFNLKGLPVKDGKIICPGHGLQFDVNTGALVPRTS